jgi:pentatricopeptide repeat protein
MKFNADMRNVEPNEATYHLLLSCVCEAGDIEQATDIVSVMKNKGFPASESVFAALVLGHARAG